MQENSANDSGYLRLAAHELKSPLAAIEGYLYLLQSRACGNDLAAYEQMIDRSVVRLAGMRKLIDNLLELAKLESGNYVREVAQIELGAIARTAIETFEVEAKRRNISVVLHTSGPMMFNAAAQEIEIILNNLISNAIKYNRDGGTVDITITHDGKAAILEVADTGIGISKEDAPRLFNEFSRIKQESTRDVPGTGIGLAIVKQLVDFYHGHVSLESTPGHGTRFTVRLEK